MLRARRPIREGLKSRIRSLVTQRTGLDEMAVDVHHLHTSLYGCDDVRIPDFVK